MKKVIVIGTALSISALSLLAGDLSGCVGCHGQHFEKKALGHSKIVKNMSKQEIKEALDGYKNKTYGGFMKNVMENQAAKIKDTNLIASEIKDGEKKPDPLSKKTSKCKPHCIAKLKKITNCVVNATEENEMQKCRTELAKFGQKIQHKFNIKL